MSAYESAREKYAAWGIDTERAIDSALAKPISIHCWQADDVGGFEIGEEATDSGGILATGNFPGKARNIDEARADYEKVLSLVPGVHRLNLHAIYADTGGKAVSRDELTYEHFRSWTQWARAAGIGLDFNPTYFAHPLAESGYTLSSPDDGIRNFWIRHGIACREIAHEFSMNSQAARCITNHWIPDGAKDSPADRWGPRERLHDSLTKIFEKQLVGSQDAVESKLFGLGSEDYVVGSFEFYSAFSLFNKVLLCLDMGHFHPTETIADKLSALLQFHQRLLLHVSRPLRWDSDHVVLYNDDLRSVFTELARGKAMERAIVALDYFDASINRIAAYVIGVRATRKAIVNALLDPFAELQEVEREGRLARKLALMEEVKGLPFGDVWDELCRRAEVPLQAAWIDEVEAYEKRVLSARN